MAALNRARLLGTRVAFDTNFRAAAGPTSNLARNAFSDAFEAADIVLAFDGRFTAALSRRRQRDPDGRHFQSGSGVEAQRAGQRPAVRRGSHEVKPSRLAKPAVDTTARGQFCSGLYRRSAGGSTRSRPHALDIVSPAWSWLSRRDHSALCHAGQENAAIGILSQGLSMTATPKQESSPRCLRRRRSSRYSPSSA